MIECSLLAKDVSDNKDEFQQAGNPAEGEAPAKAKNLQPLCMNGE